MRFILSTYEGLVKANLEENFVEKRKRIRICQTYPAVRRPPMGQ